MFRIYGMMWSAKKCRFCDIMHYSCVCL